MYKRQGYIISGVLIGPYVLNLIPEIIVERMDFVTDAALAFIAFGVGKYFKLSQLRKSGATVSYTHLGTEDSINSLDNGTRCILQSVHTHS